MRTSRPSPARVTVTEHLWIPMPDGVRLAARLWLPEDAAQAPVPALLEYIPYRKADMVRARDDHDLRRLRREATDRCSPRSPAGSET